MPFERDYFKRQIKQLVQGLARTLGLAKQEHRYDDALEAVKRAPSDWFHVDSEMLERVDPASLKLLLGESERIEAYVWLLEEEAALHDLRGDSDAAARCRTRATAIRDSLTRTP